MRLVRGVLCELAYLVRDYREALPGISRVSRLDGRIHCQEVRLRGDTGDDLVGLLEANGTGGDRSNLFIHAVQLFASYAGCFDEHPVLDGGTFHILRDRSYVTHHLLDGG